jgi:hypothetical protein
LKHCVRCGYLRNYIQITLIRSNAEAQTTAKKTPVPLATAEAQVQTETGTKEKDEELANMAAETMPTKEVDAVIVLQAMFEKNNGLIRCEPISLPKEVLEFLVQCNLVSFGQKFGKI